MNYLAVAFMLCMFANSTHAAQNYVAIVRSGAAEPYTIAVEGIRKEFIDHGETVRLFEYDLPYSPSASNPPRLIIAIGSKAADELTQRIPDIPIVYTMLMNPAYSQPNVTGVSLNISPAAQFSLYKRLVPKAHRIGVLYSPAKSQGLIDTGVLNARSMGLELVRIEVDRFEDVYNSVRTLGSRVDALWMVPDTIVYNAKSTEDILLYCLRERIPVIGLSPTYVQSGALCARSCNYRLIGTQTGRMARELLHGKTPSDIPPEEPAETEISINLIVAERNGIVVPDDIIREAVNVYK